MYVCSKKGVHLSLYYSSRIDMYNVHCTQQQSIKCTFLSQIQIQFYDYERNLFLLSIYRKEFAKNATVIRFVSIFLAHSKFMNSLILFAQRIITRFNFFENIPLNFKMFFWGHRLYQNTNEFFEEFLPQVKGQKNKVYY